MGRKKIEIRPLVDERNRNVTFLKRKAGLMKKAWELSVLCAADVSIVIFSHAGKPFEFSSRELDGEIDRYLEYEGMIERRRAPEFAAMAAAGEDDDDDDDEGDRRGGRRDSKAGAGSANGGGGAPVPKSLKGKESFKARMPSLSDLARGSKRRRGRDREGHRERGRERDDDKRGFIEGLLKRDESDEDEDRYEDKPRQQADLAALQYALTMHGNTTLPGSSRSYRSADQPYPHPYPPTPQSLFAPPLPAPPSMPSSAYPSSHSNQPLLPGQMQWDPSLLSKYAEYQLQQNHQRQQRILLERQRQQLAELGIPIDDSGLLEQLFGGVGAGQSQPPQQPQHQPQHSSQSQSQSQSQGSAMGMGIGINTNGMGHGVGMGMGGMGMTTPTVSSAEEGNSFLWPTFGRRQGSDPAEGIQANQTGGAGPSGSSGVLEHMYSQSHPHSHSHSHSGGHSNTNGSANTSVMGGRQSHGHSHGQGVYDQPTGEEDFPWPTAPSTAETRGGGGGAGGNDAVSAYLPSPTSAEEQGSGYDFVPHGHGQVHAPGKRDRQQPVEGEGDMESLREGGGGGYSEVIREDKRARLYA